MTFPAKYNGHCNADECVYGDYRISEGDAVVYVDDELCHESCVGHQRDRQADRYGPFCTECQCHHRGECW